MERKEAVKMEDWIRPFSGMLDFSTTTTTSGGGDDQAEKSSSSSFGFMDLLGFQDYYSMTTPYNSIFEMLQVPNSTSVDEQPFAPSISDQKMTNSEAAEETSEMVNHQQQQPTTPNSSSISSSVSSGTTPNDHEQIKAVVDHEDDDDDEQQKMRKSQLKPKKTCKKRQEREPRFAFMTKSEVDHLEDGYRWRKYGQKAVKNSSFPRSYYRCTNATCNVKKRVERCFSDPSVVVTTYEGKHTHPSPLMPRQYSSAAGVVLQPPTAGVGPAAFISATNFTHPMPQMSTHFNNSCGYSTYINPNSTTPTTSAHDQSLFRNTPQQTALLTDRGLLQDMVVPSTFMITKQE